MAISSACPETINALLTLRPEGVEAPLKALDVLEGSGWRRCTHDNQWYPTEGMTFLPSVGEWMANANMRAAGVFTCTQCAAVCLERNGRVPMIDDPDVSYCSRDHARRAGAFEHESGGWYTSDAAAPPVYIYRYNQTVVGPIGEPQQYPLGLELEIEFDEEDRNHDFAVEVREKYEKGVAHCKRDGSLSEYGVELVTGYGSFESIHDVVVNSTRIARDLGAKSHNTDTCGQHVSVGRAAMSPAQQARFVVFFNHTANQEVLTKFARRSSNRYARTMLDKGGDMFITKCEQDFDSILGDKYEAVNCNHATHLEVRIFRGSLRASTVMARVALVGLVAEFCEERRSARELVFPKLVEWMEHRTCKMSSCVREYMKRMDIEIGVGAC